MRLGTARTVASSLRELLIEKDEKLESALKRLKELDAREAPPLHVHVPVPIEGYESRIDECLGVEASLRRDNDAMRRDNDAMRQDRALEQKSKLGLVQEIEVLRSREKDERQREKEEAALARDRERSVSEELNR